MKPSPKYDTSGLIEAQFEPGSRGRVLRNKLGIKSRREMDRLEKQELIRANDTLSGMFDERHRFTAADIRIIHREWLGRIYDWAGEYRQVKLGKDDFEFAFPAQIPSLMTDFERSLLGKYTPCRFKSMDEIIKALAVIHTELLLIHPFREGNGRVARMLATLMALQAGLPLLDFSGIVGRRKPAYIVAVQSGMRRNYLPMEKIFKRIIRKTMMTRKRR